MPDEANDHPSHMPGLGWPILAVAGALVALSWVVTARAGAGFQDLLMDRAMLSRPASMALFILLTGVMMVAMMLPSALPMVETYRAASWKTAGPAEGSVRTILFSLAYVAVWTAFTALSLPVLAALGFMDAKAGALAYVPGLLLSAAGMYQFTGWKQYCLRHCRSPIGFMTTHHRSGRAGALRMGLDHAGHCLGCCWLLMLVWFVASAMGLLWMAVFAGLILAEKVLRGGVLVSRAIGAAALGAGALSLGLTATTAGT